jgi:lipoprotein NlpI
MRFPRFIVVAVLAVWLGSGASVLRADEADDLLKEAKERADQGQLKEALEIAGKVVQLNPVKGYFFRAALYDVVLRKHAEALADYDALIKKHPEIAEAYDQRGSVHFKMGHIKESLADFDKFLEMKPKERNGHWRRGITCYYAGKFKEGWQQFAGYEAVDTNDVENAVWHFICVAREAGIARARTAMLKIGKDPRVPMMQVYALFQGKVKPEDVLAAANKAPEGAKPQVLKNQLFYAHLYLGLYFEMTGDKKKALEHMTRAATDYVNNQYMGDVARVHLAIMEKQASPRERPKKEE